MKMSLRTAAALLAALGLSLSSGVLAQAKQFFKPVSAAKAAKTWSPLLLDTPVEALPVQFNAADMLGLGYLEEVQLTLPTGASYPVLFEHAKAHGDGITSWVGHFKERGTANRVILTTGPGGSFGVLETPDGVLRIVPGGDHDWLVDLPSEGFTGAQLLVNDGKMPPRELAKALQADPANATLFSGVPGVNMAGLPKAAPVPAVEVDVMFVVTQGLANKLGANLETRLAFLVTRANTTYTDSEVAISLRKVNTTIVNFPDNNDDSTALYNITPGCAGGPGFCEGVAYNAAGVFGGIETTRNAAGADLVTFLRDGANNGGSGVAWVGAPPSANFSYSTVQGCVAGCENVWIHEIGHNMGNRHDRHTSAFDDGEDATKPNPGFRSDSFGHVFCVSGAVTCNAFLPNSSGGCTAFPECTTNNANNFITIMGYFFATTDPIYRFSNSQLGNCRSITNNDATDRACGVLNQADAAASMNANRFNLSGLKAGLASVQFTAASYTGSETGGTITFTVSRSGPTTGAVSVNYSLSSGTATVGFDFANGGGTLNWGAGDATNKTFNVTLVNDQAPEGIETFTATLSSPSGAQLGGQSSASGVITEAFPVGTAGTLPTPYANPAGSSATWAIANDFSSDGDGSSLKSGAILFTGGLPAPSVMQVSGTFLAGTVSFGYQVNSYPGNGFFEFLVDGVVQLADSGVPGAKSFSFNITAGAHTLQWRYRPTLTFACGAPGVNPPPPQGTSCADRAWVDAIRIPLVAGNASITALQSSANPSTLGQNVTFTATVSGGAGGPTGTVRFTRNGADIAGCTAVAVASGSAACTTNALPAGASSIAAMYSGSPTYGPSQSAGLNQTVNSSFTVTVTKAGGGTGTVTSNVGGINCGATCAGSVTGSVTLTATPTGGSYFAGWSGACSGMALTCQLTPSANVTATATFTVLAGSATATPVPTSQNFGGQSMLTNAPARTVVLQNTGNGTLTVTGVSVDNANFPRSHDCPGTLAAGAFCTVTLGFVPTSEGSITGTLTFTTSAGTILVGLAGTGERSLITHYYNAILRRAPDAGGKAFWQGEAARMQGLGANVNETWYSMATFFFFSSEYTAFNRDNTGFVTDLYNTFFNRAPDGGGLAFWVGQINQGMPREVVLVSFMLSTEFVNFTQAIFGNTPVRAEINTVLDFYRGLLSRLPDNGGFANWVNGFRSAQCAATPGTAVYSMVEQISSGFATSGEYLARARTNSQYVGDLYNAFLRRGGDLAGVQFWINQLDTSAQTREQIRQAFIGTPEFNGRVNAIINQGCVN